MIREPGAQGHGTAACLCSAGRGPGSLMRSGLQCSPRGLSPPTCTAWTFSDAAWGGFACRDADEVSTPAVTLQVTGRRVFPSQSTPSPCTTPRPASCAGTPPTSTTRPRCPRTTGTTVSRPPQPPRRGAVGGHSCPVGKRGFQKAEFPFTTFLVTRFWTFHGLVVNT